MESDAPDDPYTAFHSFVKLPIITDQQTIPIEE
jgi:hypothetical protein